MNKDADATGILPRIEWDTYDGSHNLVPARTDGSQNLFPPGATAVQINRGDEYELCVSLSGKSDFHQLENWKKATFEGIVAGTQIVTFDLPCTSSPYLQQDTILENCSFGEINSKLAAETEYRLQTRVGRVSFEYFPDHDSEWLTEWCLGPELDGHLLFPDGTNRSEQKTYSRKRMSTDGDATEFTTDSGESSNRDCLKFMFGDCPVWFGKVPESLGPQWSGRVFLEYQAPVEEVPDSETRTAIKNAISFLMGGQFLNVGHSVFDKLGQVIAGEAISPWGQIARQLNKQSCYPPLWLGYETAIGPIIENTATKYVELNETIDLDQFLWTYWTAKMLPIGMDLPILSSALEGLASRWLASDKSKTRGEYLPPELYSEMIGDWPQELMQKLLGETELGEDISRKIVNKLRYGYQASNNDKLRMFFNDIELPVSSYCWTTIKDRHKFAHGTAPKSDSEIRKAVDSRNAYFCLCNRVLLKILGHTGTYTDWTTFGHPQRPIDEPMGGEISTSRE